MNVLYIKILLLVGICAFSVRRLKRSGNGDELTFTNPLLN